MPRVSFSNDYLFTTPYRAEDSFHGRYQRLSGDEQLSPNEIDEILSRKLYDQLKTTSGLEKDKSCVNPSLTPLLTSSSTNIIDPELVVLIDRFFNLTYLNTIPMVNLLATAVATNFLKESIRELDQKLQEQQTTHLSLNIKRGTSLLYEPEDDDYDDDNLSWASAPT